MSIVSDAYIILCHQAPWQVNELAGALSAAGHDVYIHVDAASHMAEQIQTSERVRLVSRREKVVWADWTVAKATLNAIREMPEYGRGYRYVHLLSGQCLPAMPLEQLDKELDESAARKVQYMECEQIPRRSAWGRDGGIHRAGTWYPRWMVSKHSPWHRWFWWYTNKWIRLRLRRPLYYLYRPFYGGAQWWSLTGECVAAIARYAVRHPLYRWFYHHTFCSDELFFQTTLQRVGYGEYLSGDNRRFLKWPFADAPSPVDLQPCHWEEIRHSGAFFARKFVHQPGETCAYMEIICNHNVKV
jgi:hypothetical protein